jgi:cell wall assembly regulator SMI1
MSMHDLRLALQLIEDNTARSRFVGPRSTELVQQAEDALGVTFPPTFREFVLRLGAGGFGGQEFFGVTTANFERSAVPNGVWLTLDERNSCGLPKEFIIISDTGYGEYYAIDLSQTNASGESPIILFCPGSWRPEDKVPIVADDFGAFILEKVKWALESS